MLENILLDIFLIICILIGLSCALVPLFKDMNDKINDKFKGDL